MRDPLFLLDWSASAHLLQIGGDCLGGSVVENPPANAGDASLIPGLGRSHMLWSN